MDPIQQKPVLEHLLAQIYSKILLENYANVEDALTEHLSFKSRRVAELDESEPVKDCKLHAKNILRKSQKTKEQQSYIKWSK